MANTLEAFKRLLQTIPKDEMKADPSSLYDHYYKLHRTYPIEMFISPKFGAAMDCSAHEQSEYNTLYKKYKELARLSQELFELS